MPHRLDTEEKVFFYMDEFYCLSNFSPFRIMWKGIDFDTSEHAYHWEKFHGLPDIQCLIRKARSAHEAFKIAERHKPFLDDVWWKSLRAGRMRDILWAKVGQHEYVHRKLLETGDRVLIEDSWRDSYWGWGPNGGGENALGKLWMEIRQVIKNQT